MDTDNVGQLHIYSQAHWHDDAFIVGDAQALRRLRDAITAALESGISASPAFAKDGEGFTTFIVHTGGKSMDRMRLPYTDSSATDSRTNACSPEQIVGAEEHKKLNFAAWHGK